MPDVNRNLTFQYITFCKQVSSTNANSSGIQSSVLQGRIQDLPREGVDHGDSVEREPIMGVWGQRVGYRGKAPSEGSGGKLPLKLKAFHLFSYKGPKV